MRERGLKCVYGKESVKMIGVAPVRERGLKFALTLAHKLCPLASLP